MVHILSKHFNLFRTHVLSESVLNDTPNHRTISGVSISKLNQIRVVKLMNILNKQQIAMKISKL